MADILEPEATGRLIDPYAAYTYTSGIGHREIEAGSSHHKGVDRATPIGTRADALDGGVVSTGFDAGGYGNWVVVLHGYTDDGRPIETLTAHLDRIDVRDGQRVAQGQQIGLTGETGVGTGPHVHVEFLVGGEPFDYTDIVARGSYTDGPVQDAPGQTPGTLREGDRGDDVARLQQRLNMANRDYAPAVDVDGDFGPSTTDAVRAFQQNRGLDPDGVAGPATLDALGITLASARDRGTLVAGPAMVLDNELGGPPADPAQVAFVRAMDTRVDALVGDRLSPDAQASLRQLAAARGADLTTRDVRTLLDRTDPGSGITGTDLDNLTIASRAVGDLQADLHGPGAAAVREARAPERDPSLPSPMDQVDPSRAPTPDPVSPLRMEPGLDGRPVPVTPDTDRQSLGTPVVAYAPEGASGGRGTDYVQQPAPVSEPMVLS